MADSIELNAAREAAVPKADPGSLPWQVARIEQASGELMSTLELLERQLSPVIIVAEPVPDEAEATPIPRTQHADNIDSAANRIEAATRQVRSMMNRLDV